GWRNGLASGWITRKFPATRHRATAARRLNNKEARMSPTNPARAARTAKADEFDTGSVERPIPSGANAPGFGSDVAAEMLRALDIPYIALNPGASYRGLHDSIVNFLGNEKPQMLLCLHEEAAIAIAHGYAKV